MLFKGIDVSRWQGYIDWAKVKASGQVEFAILRAGYGKHASQKDERFEEYYAGCKKNGIPVGVYWFSYATTKADALLEAEACYQCIKGKTFEYPVMFDYEEKSQCNSTVARNVIPAFMEAMKAKGYYVGLYSYYSLLKSYVPDDIESKYDIWVAHYASSTPYKGHKGWQYSSTGRVNGINGDVDMDYIYVDYPSIIKAAGLNGLKPDNTGSSVTEDTKPAQPTTPTTPSTPTNTSSHKAGDTVTLNNTALYSSSSTSSVASTKSGTYYIYSNEVVNGRIRITNSKSNVGKTPAGTYVTGWVKESDLSAKPVNKLDAGSTITLSGTPLYSSSSTSSVASTKSGTYYIYSNEVVNGRIRITNSKSNVGKTPAGTYVTGWVNTKDIK